MRTFLRRQTETLLASEKRERRHSSLRGRAMRKALQKSL
jgi:hypothetical protein